MRPGFPAEDHVWQALASEVVTLEERVLQAKSEELRAAKQAEADSLAARRAAQMHASAAAECANLRTMVAALQVTTSFPITRTLGTSDPWYAD